MFGPRIESIGIQRRRAENAHQGALLGHGAGSVACDSGAPLTHVKATIALSRHRTQVSTASNHDDRAGTMRFNAERLHVAPRQTPLRAAATL
jgi:hypothetical protein